MSYAQTKTRFVLHMMFIFLVDNIMFQIDIINK